MKLNELLPAYHAYISLGMSCQVAYQLDRMGLRTFSSPLDWVTSENALSVSHLLKTRFNNYMMIQNLEVSNEINGFYTALDRASGIISSHDFPVVPGQAPFAAYPDFYQTLQRRISRLYSYMQSGVSLLFIRLNATPEEALCLREALDQTVSGTYHLLIVNNSSNVLENDWGLDRICHVQITAQPERWEGHDESWNYLLKRFSPHQAS